MAKKCDCFFCKEFFKDYPDRCCFMMNISNCHTLNWWRKFKRGMRKAFRETGFGFDTELRNIFEDLIKEPKQTL